MAKPSLIILPLFLIFCYEWVLLSLHRYRMVEAFVPDEMKKAHPQVLKRMYALGARFDGKVLSMVIGIPLLIACILQLFHPTVAMGLAVFLFLSCLILNGIIVGNFYYFKTYQHYYDVFMFGLFEDDTKAVLRNIYDDYPIIRLVIIVLLSALFPAIFVYYAIDRQWFLWDSSAVQYLLSLLAILGFVLTARGSIRSKPLGRGHAQVGSLSIINKMIPDGVTAISWAIADRRAQIRFDPVSQHEGKALLQCLGGTDDFYAKTPVQDALKQNPPHVVFALMESFGQNVLVFDDEKNNDLLGSLRPYWNKDFVFKRFCADYDGTAPSLASLFFHSHVQNISQSIAQNKPLKETPFEVYKAASYTTVFITAGNMMWRNLANYLPLQGVDMLYDQNDLMEHFPEAKKTLSYWGVADEYAFAMAEKLLKESQKPLFICLLSMTNHPPYQIPSHYDPKPLAPSCLEGRYGESHEERKAMLSTYQYACDVVGRFIQSIEKGELADNTIVAVTGDHHVRGVNFNEQNALFLSKAVPLLIHVPTQMHDDLKVTFDPLRIGSHKDIMPTLYHMSLSDARYWHAGGRSLFGQSEQFAFAYHDNSLFATDEYVVDLRTEPLQAYQWSQEIGVGAPYELSDIEKQQAQAFQSFVAWQINYLVNRAS